MSGDLRNAMIQALNIWEEYPDGTAGYSTDEADAILAMPEMKAIKSYILAHLGKPLSCWPPALWEGLVTERLIREGLPESVIGWVLDEEASRER